MALIMIGGDSGHGKSTSMRNLDPKETFIIQVIPKPLPFPKWKTNYPLMDKTTFKGNRYVLFEKEHAEGENPSKDYMTASKKLRNMLTLITTKKPEINNIILDDTQYIMSYEYMARAREKGFDRFSAIAQNFFDVIKKSASLGEDHHVVFLHHTETVDQIRKVKTIGKLLDNMITIEGMFSIVLMTDVERVDGMNIYKFITHSNGTNTVKSPMGMFDTDDMGNDLVEVFKAVDDYE